MKRILGIFSPFFRSALVVLVASLFVMSVVYAATTIGSNITTGGNLTVTGNATISGAASSTSATSTAYLMVGGGFTLPSSFNYRDDLAVNGDTVINGKATTTSLWIGGSGSGTATSTTAASGDLFVDNSLEVKNKMYVGGGLFSLSSGTPTSTKGLFVGATGNTGTTTVGIGTVDTGGVNGCIELTKAGLYYACYIDPVTPPVIVCSVNRCNP